VAELAAARYIHGLNRTDRPGEVAMSRSPRRSVPGARIISAAAIAVSALVILVPSSAGAHRVARAAAPPACSSSQLVNWLDTNANGTAGTIFYELQFTNLGGTCTLRGYPGVSAVSLSGKQLGSPARRVTGIKLKTITIKRGATAKAALGVVDTGAIPSSQCKAVTAAGLRVIAPNTTGSTVIPFPFSTCSASGPSSLTIRPVTK
jgi:Protein of unknown function (DUF4232)